MLQIYKQTKLYYSQSNMIITTGSNPPPSHKLSGMKYFPRYFELLEEKSDCDLLGWHCIALKVDSYATEECAPSIQPGGKKDSSYWLRQGPSSSHNSEQPYSSTPCLSNMVTTLP